MQTPQLAASLKGRALRLLTMREHSRDELERKLSRTRKAGEIAPDPAALAAVLDELQELGLLDAQRFAESLVRRRAAKYGSQRIGQELRTHKLDDATVSSALATLDTPLQDDLTRALHILHRRYPEPASSPQERARQQRFLLARGFPHDVVRQAMKAHAATAGAHALDDFPEDGADDATPPDDAV
jgi:regulatory protein